MKKKSKEEWEYIGGIHISTDDYEDHGWGLEAKGAYYRISHSFRDTHPYYAANAEDREWNVPKHRAEVMIRLLRKDKEWEWIKAIQRRERRRSATKLSGSKRGAENEC